MFILASRSTIITLVVIIAVSIMLISMIITSGSRGSRNGRGYNSERGRSNRGAGKCSAGSKGK